MDMQQDELREILEEFYTEAEESLDILEQDLIKLENLSLEGGETDSETVDRIFRVLHTLKGGAGFLGLDKMTKLAHAGETLLDEVRGGRVHIDKKVMDALLASMDSLQELLKCERAGESVENKDNSALIETLEKLACADDSCAAPAPEIVPAEEPEPISADEQPVAAEPSTEPAVAEKSDDSVVNQDLLAEVMGDDSLDPSKDTELEQDISTATASPQKEKVKESASVEASAEPVAAEKSDDSIVNQDLLSEVMGDDSLDPSKNADEKGNAEPKQAASQPEPVVATETPAPQDQAAVAPVMKRGEAPEERRSGDEDSRRKAEDRRTTQGRRVADAANETVRVEVGRLDKVMNLVGELVLARNSLVNQLNQPQTREVLSEVENIPLIQSGIEQLSRVTQDLQMSVLSTRMQPIKKIFDKIPRQVRDLKSKLGREVDLVIEGEMTEVDKSLVEELSDPMVHMIRNALDHGIEPPEERKANGKHPTGTLTVRAFYEGNNVVVQVQEDGKGIDPVAIRNIAIKKGVITETAAAALSDEESVRLIMAAGFSTAEVISDVSGRGVGMDVVNSKITSLKGTLDIQSELGVGTTFSIYLPLTLAIVQALVVSSNSEGFAIPIGDISEVIQFSPEAIHKMSNQDVIELRGDALPLYYLSKLTKEGFSPPIIVDKPVIKKAEEKPVEADVQQEGGEMSIDELERAAARAAGELVDEDVVSSVSVQGANNGFVVVVRDGSSSLGLVVDKLIGQEEAVVKPVTEVFDYHEAVSGATITGDGAVHMILDVPYMLKFMTSAKA